MGWRRPIRGTLNEQSSQGRLQAQPRGRYAIEIHMEAERGQSATGTKSDVSQVSQQQCWLILDTKSTTLFQSNIGYDDNSAFLVPLPLSLMISVEKHCRNEMYDLTCFNGFFTQGNGFLKLERTSNSNTNKTLVIDGPNTHSDQSTSFLTQTSLLGKIAQPGHTDNLA